MKKNILIGVCGGIAAYKTAELVRLLKKEGIDVRVMMTEAATNFVSPLTFQALSGHPVADNLLDTDQEAAMGHIEFARWADMIVVAPATADFIARLSNGFANDLVSAVCLATKAPVLIAPAMNSAMWNNAATRDNCARLISRNIRLLGPDSGELACGESGEGRMLEPDEILQRLKQTFAQGPMLGKRVLITAGPTREAIDPIRYLSNHSSGKMGYALAEAMRDAGAEVTLISGPSTLQAPRGVTRIDVVSALDMHGAVFSALRSMEGKSFELFVACAAVADYRPVNSSAHKMKKQDADAGLSLTPNPDILAEVAALPPGQRPFCVGFAAETENAVEQGEQKRQRKNVDMLAANLVGGKRGGFDDDDNAVTLLWQGGRAELPMMPKRTLAVKLTELISEHFNHATRSTEDK